MNNLGMGVSVLVVGMGVVFSVLLILMIVASLFKYIFKGAAEKESVKNTVVANNSAAPAQPRTAEFKPGFDTEDGELVAVIASSIAAALNTGSGDIKIRSIRKVD